MCSYSSFHYRYSFCHWCCCFSGQKWCLSSNVRRAAFLLFVDVLFFLTGVLLLFSGLTCFFSSPVSRRRGSHLLSEVLLLFFCQMCCYSWQLWWTSFQRYCFSTPVRRGVPLPCCSSSFLMCCSRAPPPIIGAPPCLLAWWIALKHPTRVLNDCFSESANYLNTCWCTSMYNVYILST